MKLGYVLQSRVTFGLTEASLKHAPSVTSQFKLGGIWRDKRFPLVQTRNINGAIFRAQKSYLRYLKVPQDRNIQ